MEIRKTGDFLREFKKLPADIKKLCKKQETIFADNWLDQRLHAKRIKELPGAYSFRVTRRYRTLFYFRGSDTAVFFNIGHRKDVYDL